MTHICRSIAIDAPVATVFDISNRIDQWPEIIPEYLKAEILGWEGRKIWFRLTNAQGASWRSWRMLHPPYLAYAERFDPLAPFEYNHLTWVYQALPGNRTLMTWDMLFELRDEHKPDEATWVSGMESHTEANQAAMKKYIEELQV